MEPRRRHSLRAEQQGRPVPHRGGRRNAPGGDRPRCANLLASLARLPARPEAFPDVCAGVGCAEERHLVRLPRRAARRKPVIATTGSVALAADDLLYVRDGVLVRQRFDAKDQKVIGETSTLADGMIFYRALARRHPHRLRPFRSGRRAQPHLDCIRDGRRAAALQLHARQSILTGMGAGRRAPLLQQRPHQHRAPHTSQPAARAKRRRSPARSRTSRNTR